MPKRDPCDDCRSCTHLVQRQVVSWEFDVITARKQKKKRVICGEPQRTRAIYSGRGVAGGIFLRTFLCFAACSPPGT